VMDFFGSGDGCDGCDGLSIKSPQLNDDDVAPQHHKNPYTECAEKTPPIRHKPPKSSPEPVPAVTSPSQVRHSPSHPSLELLSAAAKPATIAQNPPETSPSDSDVDKIGYSLDREVKIGSKVQRNSVERPGQSPTAEILGCKVVNFSRGDWKVVGLDGSIYNVPTHKFQCGEWTVAE
jgi:hypothetical protein